MYICVYVYMCICVYAYKYICMYVRVCTYMSICVPYTVAYFIYIGSFSEIFPSSVQSIVHSNNYYSKPMAGTI